MQCYADCKECLNGVSCKDCRDGFYRDTENGAERCTNVIRDVEEEGISRWAIWTILGVIGGLILLGLIFGMICGFSKPHPDSYPTYTNTTPGYTNQPYTTTTGYATAYDPYAPRTSQLAQNNPYAAAQGRY